MKPAKTKETKTKETLDELKAKAEAVKETAINKVHEVDVEVKKHPYKAMAIVAGALTLVGTVTGWLLGRQKK